MRASRQDRGKGGDEWPAAPNPNRRRSTGSGSEAGSSIDALDRIEISLAYLRELLLQWRDVWAKVIEEIEELTPTIQQRLQQLSTDPYEGLLDMSGVFATAIHPDVAHSLVSNLEAAPRTVEHLRNEQERDSDPNALPTEQVEQRLERLEAIVGGVGAVLRTLDLRSREDET